MAAPRGALGVEINVHWPSLGWYKCKLVGFVDAYSWAPDEPGWAYVIESVTKKYGTCRYVYRPSDVWDRLTQQQQDQISAAAEARAAEPPPFVPEQLFHVDQHHKKCRSGKVSCMDCKLPMKDGAHCTSLTTAVSIQSGQTPRRASTRRRRGCTSA